LANEGDTAYITSAIRPTIQPSYAHQSPLLCRYATLKIIA